MKPGRALYRVLILSLAPIAYHCQGHSAPKPAFTIAQALSAPFPSLLTAAPAKNRVGCSLPAWLSAGLAPRKRIAILTKVA